MDLFEVEEDDEVVENFIEVATCREVLLSTHRPLFAALLLRLCSALLCYANVRFHTYYIFVVP